MRSRIGGESPDAARARRGGGNRLVTDWRFGPGPFLIAGPCVVEDDATMLRIAERLAAVGERHGSPVCFKASFDKANRARGDAPRGPGLDAGLAALERVRDATGLPVLTDVHESAQVAAVADVVDVLQIPAFLCRQTDLLLAAGATGKPVNIKKGQWMEAAAMAGRRRESAQRRFDRSGRDRARHILRVR